MKILIIIPAFNEEGNLPTLLDELKIYCDKYDVVVIDDASKDNTARIARERNVPVIRLPANLGIGGAVQTGFKYAVLHNYEIAAQVDGDGQHNPAWLDRIIIPVIRGDADCVIGSRYVKDNPDRNYKTPFFRRIGMIFSTIVLFLATGKWISDTTSGFRAFNHKLLDYCANEYPVDHPEAEALLLLLQRGFTLKEVPVQMRSRQSGHSLFTFVKSVKYPVRVLIGFLGLLLKKNKQE
ncbi:MAG: glycosyltransferase family 2 protein [Chloroflexota bacterium]